MARRTRRGVRCCGENDQRKVSVLWACEDVSRGAVPAPIAIFAVWHGPHSDDAQVQRGPAQQIAGCCGHTHYMLPVPAHDSAQIKATSSYPVQHRRVDNPPPSSALPDNSM